MRTRSENSNMEKIRAFPSSNGIENTRRGYLWIGQRFRKNNRTYYHCQCDCGNSLDVLEDNLLNKGRIYIACRCKGKYVEVGQKYGDLEVVKKIDNKHWDCICVCGKHVFLTGPELLRGNNQSCGCRISGLRSALRSDSTTKVKGVCYVKRRSKYVAYVNHNHKRWNLGHFDTLKQAADARQRAEEYIKEHKELSEMQ